MNAKKKTKKKQQQTLIIRKKNIKWLCFCKSICRAVCNKIKAMIKLIVLTHYTDHKFCEEDLAQLRLVSKVSSSSFADS